MAKVLDSPTAEQVFVLGQSMEKPPRRAISSLVISMRKLPSYLAIRNFSESPQLSDLDTFTLEADDIQPLLSNCAGSHHLRQRYGTAQPARLLPDYSRKAHNRPG